MLKKISGNDTHPTHTRQVYTISANIKYTQHVWIWGILGTHNMCGYGVFWVHTTCTNMVYLIPLYTHNMNEYSVFNTLLHTQHERIWLINTLIHTRHVRVWSILYTYKTCTNMHRTVNSIITITQ